MKISGRLIRALALSTLIFLTVISLTRTAVAQTSKNAQPTPSQVQVDLLRGLADIFSRGMDTLAERLNRQGYSARVYSTNGWQSIAHRIADKYSQGHKGIIVLIGHSLGANATFDIARYLDRQNIPIELIVTFDATRPQPVSKNVLHFVNFYQQNGFGEKVVGGPGFQGELTNVDLTADPNLSHVTIEKSLRLHMVVTQKIEEVVKRDLKSRLGSKAKKKKQVSFYDGLSGHGCFTQLARCAIISKLNDCAAAE